MVKYGANPFRFDKLQTTPFDKNTTIFILFCVSHLPIFITFLSQSHESSGIDYVNLKNMNKIAPCQNQSKTPQTANTKSSHIT